MKFPFSERAEILKFHEISINACTSRIWAQTGFYHACKMRDWAHNGSFHIETTDRHRANMEISWNFYEISWKFAHFCFENRFCQILEFWWVALQEEKLRFSDFFQILSSFCSSPTEVKLFFSRFCKFGELHFKCKSCVLLRFSCVWVAFVTGKLRFVYLIRRNILILYFFLLNIQNATFR